MSLSDATRARIDDLVRRHRVLLFMKGTRHAPRCGFSARVIGMLDEIEADYETLDVLSDPEIREGVKVYSSWPTIPQLYLAGEFIGGCDIVTELFESGELAQKLGGAPADRPLPAIHVSDAAAVAFTRILADAPGRAVHLSIDPRFQNQLFLSEPRPGSVEVSSNGIAIRLDRASCGRADGVAIDAVPTDDGPGFRIDNPNTPNVVRLMTVAQLKQRLDAREPMRLIDVRSADEHAKAQIPGAELLDPDLVKHLEALPKDTTLVFHCHHGTRSQAAAEHFAQLGFRSVWSVNGGIDAWASEIDPTVPRY